MTIRPKSPQNKPELTAERLRRLLHYCPQTGVFTNKIKRPGRSGPSGSVAGTLHSEGYVQICIDQRLYLAHRLAWFYMTSEWPEQQIDHRNRIRGDTRWKNLRLSTGKQNSHNSSPSRRNKTGTVGVRWRTERRKWLARIHVNGKTITLGHYDSLDDAIKARHDAEIEHFGDFASLTKRGN